MPTEHSNVWKDPSELSVLPGSGPAWDKMKAAAASVGPISLDDQDEGDDVDLLARALVATRVGVVSDTSAEFAAIRQSCMDAIGTETGGRTLALGRNLCPLVIAADYADLRDRTFVKWVRAAMHESLEGKTLISTHEDRPNNWGTHAGASRIAANMFLVKYGTNEERREARAELQRCWLVFQGWCGDRSKYIGFDFGELDWQAEPSLPVGINAMGTELQRHPVDGVLPDDQRRAGGFTWPPPKENYVWEALQGAVVQAVLLSRLIGALPFTCSDRAILRAVTWLHDECKFPASGDDTWIPHLVNWAYGSSFPAPVPSSPGKNMGGTCWSHAGRRVQTEAPTATAAPAPLKKAAPPPAPKPKRRA